MAETLAEKPKLMDFVGNPMEEDYYDPTKNAYPNRTLTQQPGYKALQKITNPNPEESVSNLLVESTAPSQQLHVFNVPEDLSSIGLRNKFGPFGKIIDHVLGKVNTSSFKESPEPTL